MTDNVISGEIASNAEEIKKNDDKQIPTNAEESSESILPPKYQIRPKLTERFQSSPIKEIIDQTMHEMLSGSKYDSTQAEKLVKSIASVIKERVNALEMKRYKLIVQVILGEVRGAGINSGIRCLWDSECDNYVSDLFQNEHLFCSTTVFGIYFY